MAGSDLKTACLDAAAKPDDLAGDGYFHFKFKKLHL